MPIAIYFGPRSTQVSHGHSRRSIVLTYRPTGEQTICNRLPIAGEDRKIDFFLVASIATDGN
jgi:hypothetical protein